MILTVPLVCLFGFLLLGFCVFVCLFSGDIASAQSQQVQLESHHCPAHRLPGLDLLTVDKAPSQLFLYLGTE